jgi:hypothetical protein
MADPWLVLGRRFCGFAEHTTMGFKVSIKSAPGGDKFDLEVRRDPIGHSPLTALGASRLMQVSGCCGGCNQIEDTELTVEALKTMIEKKADVPSALQRLIYKGHVLRDARTLASYGKRQHPPVSNNSR